MTEPIDRILDLRDQKERIQQANLLKAKQQLESCELALKQQREALEEFRTWRQAQEDALFRALQEQRATPRELMEYLARCELLKQEESARTQALAKAEQALEAARNQVVVARQAVRDATRAKERLSALVDELDRSRALAHQRADEDELDDTIMAQTNWSRRV